MVGNLIKLIEVHTHTGQIQIPDLHRQLNLELLDLDVRCICILHSFPIVQVVLCIYFLMYIYPSSYRWGTPCRSHSLSPYCWKFCFILTLLDLTSPILSISWVSLFCWLRINLSWNQNGRFWFLSHYVPYLSFLPCAETIRWTRTPRGSMAPTGLQSTKQSGS